MDIPINLIIAFVWILMAVIYGFLKEDDWMRTRLIIACVFGAI